jgi:RNA polymerase sigma-54 factor
MFQIQSTQTRAVTTVHLVQTMRLIGLTNDELRQEIENELAQNPALELVQERICPNCNRRLPPKGPCPVCSAPQFESPDVPIVFVSPSEDFFGYTGSRTGGEDIDKDDYIPNRETLAQYVMRQIAPELTLGERHLAHFVLNQLDSDGLLTSTSPAEIARFNHVPMSRVEQVLSKIHRADPVGVGAVSPKQALLIQIDMLSEQLSDDNPYPGFAIAMLKEGLELLSRRNFPEIARLLGITETEARETFRFITENLTPYPGRAYWGDAHGTSAAQPKVYHNPDVIVSFVDDNPENPIRMEIVMPHVASIRVNPLFQRAVTDAPAGKAGEWQKDMDKANLLVKCIQQRNHTIVRMMARIAELQRDFFVHGPTHLKSLTRAALADELDVHEATISRAVSGKTIQLPNRKIVPLALVFDRSLPTRLALKRIISEETKPLTDTQLKKVLDQQGIHIARRTVAKYRQMEGILPANLRAAPISAVSA